MSRVYAAEPSPTLLGSVADHRFVVGPAALHAATRALAKSPDETSALASWAIPMAHDWETWGDARGHDGTATIMQPMALPLYDGMSTAEIIARFQGEEPGTDLAAVRQTWREQLGTDDAWRHALMRGVVPATSKPLEMPLAPTAATASPPTPAATGLHLLFRPDPRLHDGRYANNPWLQELPAPLTKLTWDNPLLIAPDLARRLKLRAGDKATLRAGDKATLRTGTGTLTLPVWVVAGQAADVALLWLGNGRHVTGAVGTGVGWDVYPLTGGDGAATLAKAKGRVELASTDHHNLLDYDASTVDDIVRHADLEAFAKDPRFAKRPETPELYWRKPPGPVAWAMSVDLNSCIGCNACMVACQAENNVPSVGKDEVLREREMHWLRIDRYYEGSADAPESFFQPMLCMHCEKAPCEVVCPVGATVHDSEGLNVMVYNRCIGTRFCSNNCPYKVRRFNFFDFAGDANRPPVSWNPDVSVRARGVMEKCSYCLQRIVEARITADKENRRVGPQEVVTACQAACPTQAFTFGDMAQAGSDVAKRKASPLDYALLEDQHTHPRTTYEALIRNPNPALKETRG